MTRLLQIGTSEIVAIFSGTDTVSSVQFAVQPYLKGVSRVMLTYFVMGFRCPRMTAASGRHCIGEILRSTQKDDQHIHKIRDFVIVAENT